VGDRLVQHFLPLVDSIVRRILGATRRDEWEDARQVVFLRLFSRLHTWRAECPFCQWLAVVAARVSINWTNASRLPEALKPAALAAPAPAGTDDAEPLAHIERHVAGWPQSRQQLFRWLCEGVSREEMARRLHVSERSIYRQVHAMRQELLAILPD
jgi:RNA polymerase sigma factor (sigma-70 family)